MNKKEALIIEISESKKKLEGRNLKKIKNLIIECYNSLTTYIGKITNIQEEKEKINLAEEQLILLNKYINLYNLENSTRKSEKTLRKIENCILICKNTIN